MNHAIIGLGILAIVVVLFLTEWIPSAATAVLGCVLFVVTGISKFSTVFSGFSDSTTILVFGMMVVGEAMFCSGLAYDIGNFVLKISKGSERRILLVLGLSSAILSAFLSNLAVIAMFLAIASSIIQTSDSIKMKDLYLAVTMGAIFGGTLTLVGSTPQQAANALLTGTTGETMQVFDFVPVGVVTTALYLVFIIFLGLPLGKRIWGGRYDEGITSGQTGARETSARLVQGDKRKKVLMLVIFVFMVYSYSTGLFSVGITAAISALLCLIFRITDEKHLMKTLNIPIVIRLAGCLGLAKGLADSGACDLIVNGFIGLFGEQIPAFGLLAVTVFLTIVLSNFVSNSTAVTIVLVPTLAICRAFGFHTVTFTLALSYASNLALCTPLASGQIAMSLAAGYRFSDYFKYNIILQILVYAGIILAVPVFHPLYAAG